MKLFKTQKNSGFTIIEALVAISILSISVVGMLGVTASTISTARYANNEITANYLLQEAIDSIRNSRDTMVFQGGKTWTEFLNRYGYPSGKCFSPRGCRLKIEDFDATGVNNGDVVVCPSSGGCPLLNYESSPPVSSPLFYKYNSGKLSKFKRTTRMAFINADEVKVTVTVEWKNGSLQKSQSLETYLLNWQN